MTQESPKGASLDDWRHEDVPEFKKMTLNHRSLVTISRFDLDGAAAAASEHIAPCGHNELENIYAAVEAAFNAVGLSIEPPLPAAVAPLNGLTPDMVTMKPLTAENY
jgi:hypothetical protein